VRPEEIARRREKPINAVRFGEQVITTKVFLMSPAGRDELTIDVTDYMWEGEAAHA
jgi:hypothetical protein